MYAEYSFYVKNGQNKLTKKEFAKLARRAGERMEYFTFDRIVGIELTDRMRLCLCDIVDYLCSAEENPVKSESVGKWSVSYAVSDYALPENANAAIQEICRQYLTRPVNLMFVGGAR